MGQLSVERMQRMEAISHEYFSWLNVLQEAGVKDIQDLQGQYLLKCPFHEDKRPSFRIRLKEHNYHCFSCNCYGTVIDLMWKLSNMDISKSKYMEQVLKRTPNMQRELGFSSLFIDARTLDPAFSTRRRFDAKSHLGSSMPLSTLSRRVRALGDSWENLAYSLTLLQDGETPDNIYARMSKTEAKKGSEPLQAMSLADIIGAGGSDD